MPSELHEGRVKESRRRRAIKLRNAENQRKYDSTFLALSYIVWPKGWRNKMYWTVGEIAQFSMSTQAKFPLM